MSNFTYGGIDTEGRPFAYYETIPGGAGAGPKGPGEHAIQTHMTNTGNTPTESLESTFPIRMWRFERREGSGGEGLHPGGDGVVKEVEFLVDTDVAVIGDRRVSAPYGLQGGFDGASAQNEMVHSNGKTEALPGYVQRRFLAGERLRISTPGGGGWGPPEETEMTAR
jgi:N-methylhydantoinase B